MRITGKGLAQLTTDALAKGLQVTDSNPMLGVDSRANLLRGLGKSLLAHPDIFGEAGRPGNAVGKLKIPTHLIQSDFLADYLLKSASDSTTLDILTFWDLLQTLLIPIWPQDRTTIDGSPIGDAWPLSALAKQAGSAHDDKTNPEFIQPFHKLTQWLTYSLMVPFQRILGITWLNAKALTALPEYRNGGLFVDMGVLSLKKDTLEAGLKASGESLPSFAAGDDVIVEWRAMTLVLIDKLYPMILSRMDGAQLSMAQLLEAGTWKSGRETAAKLRPKTKSSPIIIQSDGTVF